MLEKGDIIKEKWNKENETSSAINDYLEFEENLNKINEINNKYIKYNSNKTYIIFRRKIKKMKNLIQTFGYIEEQEENDNESMQNNKSKESSRKSSSSNKSRESSIKSSSSNKSKINKKFFK